MNNKKIILINGDFLCRKLTGIERYAHEITLRLDKISKPNEIAVIFPKNTKNIPVYSNFKIINHNVKIRSHLWWKMFTLQLFLITHRQYIILDFGNSVLPAAPGIVFLHDIYCEYYPEDFISLKDKIIRLYNRWQYRKISKKALHIATVSEFSKNEIIKTFNTDPSKISVIYSSADHMQFINTSDSVFNDFPVLRDRPFYFSLGSLSKRKNLKWIISAALKNPDYFFAISGSSLPTVKVTELDDSIPLNIILLGYLSDEKVKTLMLKCKAFILPSYYEGFGLTPLEALSCGTQIIVSNSASLPEIYGNTAHYIDPFNSDVNLEELLKEPVQGPEKLFEKYTFDNASSKVYNIIQGFTK